MLASRQLKRVKAGVLDIAYYTFGEPNGWPCVLSHGFPYDVHAYEAVAPILADAGAWVIVPYLRGYGATKFLSEKTPRSGEQAALASDLLALLDALSIDRAVVGGYDWGGRAACIVSALWPERVIALVTGNSYNIQNIARSLEPAAPKWEASYWYQYYFHSERGRRGLSENRLELTRLLWSMWSPRWEFDDACFERTALAFKNEDFVDVVVHSYRHRYGLVPGDPACAHVETRLTATPVITVPTVAIDGDADGVSASTAGDRGRFTGRFDYRVFPDAGHNLPQERPDDWSRAVVDAYEMASHS